MDYQKYENLLSKKRLQKYFKTVGCDESKSIFLYEKNIELSQSFYGILSYFEIILRNKINDYYCQIYGAEWLTRSIDDGGFFTGGNFVLTARHIREKTDSLGTRYSHDKLVAEMTFGFWRYLFSKSHFNAGGKTLLKVFPKKPKSSKEHQFNEKFCFKKLGEINNLRNRVAHHEPICFDNSGSCIDTCYSRQAYDSILLFFEWMDVDAGELLSGVDNVENVLYELEKLKA